MWSRARLALGRSAPSGRLRTVGALGSERDFALAAHPERLDIPLRRRRPAARIVCPMSGPLRDAVDDAFIDRIFDAVKVRRRCQILSKVRSGRAGIRHRVRSRSTPGSTSPRKVAGTACPGSRICGRAPPRVRFPSCEPLLENLDESTCPGIRQLIAGGESERRMRPMAAVRGRWRRDRMRCILRRVLHRAMGRLGPVRRPPVEGGDRLGSGRTVPRSDARHRQRGRGMAMSGFPLSGFR